MTLEQIAQQLKELADKHPYNPIVDGMMNQRHRRDFVFDHWDLRVQFTKTNLGTRHVYHLSVGSTDPAFRIQDIPEPVIQRVRKAFFPKEEGSPMPSPLGNSRQFIGAV